MKCCLLADPGAAISTLFLFNLLHNKGYQPTLERLLYSTLEGDLSVLGYGSVLRLQSISELAEYQSHMSTSAIAIGGETFNSNEDTRLKGWIIPQIEIRSTSKASYNVTLALNIRIPRASQWAATLARYTDLLRSLSFDCTPHLRYPLYIPPLDKSTPTMESSSLSNEEYVATVQEALAAMQTGQLQKVVIAVKKSGRTQGDIDPAALLLAVANSSRGDEGKRYTFLFAPHGLHDEVFISLSPERLCKVDGHQLVTEALAGTFPRQDFQRDADILDDKTRREHGCVSEYISGCLSSLSGRVAVQELKTHALKDVVHLKQVISVVTDEASVFAGPALLQWATEHLHPTPAVCGLPTAAAKEFIEKHEKMSRGLYASYCGAITASGGDIFVGLRSAVTCRNKVDVYAGAGLVVGSVAIAEWAEIGLKMSQYIRVLEGVRRPAITGEFPNATAAMAAMVVEEMIRQGVGAFVVCPGSRSTPLAVAIYRNTVARAMTQVIHDERAAGFYAVGCARAGVLCAVLVTSGTAVANLLPAVSEAREARLAIVLLTADRPSESRSVGEAQTILQPGIFKSCVGFECDFQPLSSDDITLSSSLMSSYLAEISFGIGEVAVRRNQAVHFNFQIRKPEIDPDLKSAEFEELFQTALHPKVKRWMVSPDKYTSHSTIHEFIRSSLVVPRLRRWVQRESDIWSIAFVVGELSSLQDAQDLRWLAEEWRIPCICDVNSMMSRAPATPDNADTAGEVVFFGSDRLLNFGLFGQALGANIRLLFRIGGPVISARLHDWVNKLPLAKIVRIRDDGFSECRHDPNWTADYYVHGSVAEFAQAIALEFNSGLVTERPADCAALQLLQQVNSINAATIPSLFEAASTLSEPQIALSMQSYLSRHPSPVFLSSSMACRDFDAYSHFYESPSGLRRLGCNRGANGIDGVISSATGFAFASASASSPALLLIGDIACLHDMTGISIAAGSSPGHDGQKSILGGGCIGKIICINNSGGAIFSFLPAAKYRDDFFTPFLDTPHSLDLSAIAKALCGSTTDRKCVRVTSITEFEAALGNPAVFFIECATLPDHLKNFQLHRDIGQTVARNLDALLVDTFSSRLRWTMHVQHDESPLLVLLHGWGGMEGDWKPIIEHLQQHCKVSIITVDCNACPHPNVFVHGLRSVLLKLNHRQPLVFIGYSLGARLAMHYRSLCPDDVHSVIAISSAPGKSQSTDVEVMALDALQSAYGEGQVKAFLRAWYAQPVFADIIKRRPEEVEALIARRVAEGSFHLHTAMCDMVNCVSTADAKVDLAIMGQLDVKYVSLAHVAKEKGQIQEIKVIPDCGHALLMEVPPEHLCASILDYIAQVSSPPAIAAKASVPLSTESVVVPAVASDVPVTVLLAMESAVVECEVAVPMKVCKVSAESFAVPLNPPLEVLTNGINRIFHQRRGVRIIVQIKNDEGATWSGLGEVYEAVFGPGDPDDPMSAFGLSLSTRSVAQQLEGASFDMIHTAAGVASAAKVLLRPFKAVAPHLLFGFQQSILHVLSRASRTSLSDCIGAYIGKSTRRVHVAMNGFASIRANNQQAIVVSGGVVKVKVGEVRGTAASADALRINYLVASNPVANDRWLRLDANQSWTVEQAIDFATALTDEVLNVLDYIEEPLKPTALLNNLYTELLNRCPRWKSMRIALDETLCLDSQAETVITKAIVQCGGLCNRWVVKPALVSLDSPFLNNDSETVAISCTFETGVGLAFLVCLAQFYDTVHGIHARGDMALADKSTEAFLNLVQQQGGTSFVSTAAVEELLEALES